MLIKKFSYLLLLITLNAMSQSTSMGDYNSSSSRSFDLYFHEDASASAKNIEGSTYINSAFLPSKVTGLNLVTPPMRYNAYKDEIEFLKDEKTFYLTKSDSLEVKLLGTSYKYLEYQVKDGNESGFLIQLYFNIAEKVSLYKKEKVVYVEKSEAVSGYDEDKPARYKKEDDKFYIKVSDKIIFMPKKKKELLALFPNNEKDVEGFIKTNKISLDEENDLITLVKFLNTLK